LVGTLLSTYRDLKRSSRAVGDYMAIADKIRPGSAIVRLRYQMPALAEKYGFEGIPRDPLLHVDALIAARCKCVDLSDYQAPSLVFPTVFAPSVRRAQQYGFWWGSFEGPGVGTSETLAWVRTNLPVTIDYVILMSDDAAHVTDPEYAKVLANLNAGMRLVTMS